MAFEKQVLIIIIMNMKNAWNVLSKSSFSWLEHKKKHFKSLFTKAPTLAPIDPSITLTTPNDALIPRLQSTREFEWEENLIDVCHI